MRRVTSPGVSEERLKVLPQSSGVYLMRNAHGEVIYIGKAKELRTRVRSYFCGADERWNVPFIVENVVDIETIITADERQAIILEAELIRKFKPHYNVRLKDDRAHLMVRLDQSQEWPRLELVRTRGNDQAKYFGPFAFGYELRTLWELIREIVPLRSCSDRVLYNRVRPCLEYQIKRCSAPCCGKIGSAEYGDYVEQAVRLLEGETEEVVAQLQQDMDEASAKMHYEEAAEIRDRLKVLKEIKNRPTSESFGPESMDVCGYYREGNKAEISILSARYGRFKEAVSYGFTAVQVPDEELLASVLTQYYFQGHQLPDILLLPRTLEDEQARAQCYSELRAGRGEGKRVEIQTPQRGAKQKLLSLANTNAKHNFEARFSDQEREGRIALALEEEFQLKQAPRVIECADISHFQGAATVGAVVRFVDLKPDKARYRCFHLSQTNPDDFASMREMIKRHLSRCLEENSLPDLLVIDGGLAQLSQALAVRAELDLSSPEMIALAKKRPDRVPAPFARGRSSENKPERVYLEGRSVPLVLAARSEVLFLLERIRDEAHRFAVGFHRRTRKKGQKSQLEDIAGIGEKRRLLLLREFGSAAKVLAASAEEIQTRTGLPLPLARRLRAALRRRMGNLPINTMG